MEEYEDIVDFINRTPDTTVNSNSCVARLPNEETIYCSDEQNTQVASDKIQTRFYITIHRDVKLKAVELAEIFPYLKYDRVVYSRNINPTSQYFHPNSLSSYYNQVIELKSSHYMCKLEEQIGQDLREGVDIVITGSLKLTCKKDQIETVAVDNDYATKTMMMVILAMMMMLRRFIRYFNKICSWLPWIRQSAILLLNSR